uniref:Uncharacterized protein n=1 Tax=Arundo donax TaxID=35708 RepID=A0A0A9B552_ARUDO
MNKAHFFQTHNCVCPNSVQLKYKCLACRISAMIISPFLYVQRNLLDGNDRRFQRSIIHGKGCACIVLSQ